MVDAAETGGCGPIAEWTESGRRRGESLEWSGAAEVTGAEAPGQGLDSPMTPLKTRILFADDHAVARDGLRMLLNAKPDLRVVAQAGDGAEAVTAGIVDDIDLAILDIAMPRMTGPCELKRRPPGNPDPDPVDARERAVSVLGTQGRRFRRCREDRRRPRPCRGLPRGDAR